MTLHLVSRLTGVQSVIHWPVLKYYVCILYFRILSKTMWSETKKRWAFLWNSKHRQSFSHYDWFHHRDHRHRYDHLWYFQQRDFNLRAVPTFTILITFAYTWGFHSQLVASAQFKYSSKIQSTLNYTTAAAPFCHVVFNLCTFGILESKMLKLTIKFDLIKDLTFNKKHMRANSL